MNLILFSSFFEDKKVHDFILEKSKNRDPKICVIPSFTNFYGVTSTGEYRALVKMGFNHENMSMFDVGYLWDETKVDSLMENDVIILGGGNTFLFQWLLRTHDMLNILNRFVSNGGILIGESAGSIMMSKTVEIARFATCMTEIYIACLMVDILSLTMKKSRHMVIISDLTTVK